MAHPIPLKRPGRDAASEQDARLQGPPAHHAEAILAAYEVLEGLHERGVLEFLRGLLGSSDKVLEIAVEAARTPESLRGMRNLLLLVKTLGSVPPEHLEIMTRAIPQALKAATREADPPSLWELMNGTLWNADARRGLAALTGMLEAFGKNLSREEN